jgi:hypothetical protein
MQTDEPLALLEVRPEARGRLFSQATAGAQARLDSSATGGLRGLLQRGREREAPPTPRLVRRFAAAGDLYCASVAEVLAFLQHESETAGLQGSDVKIFWGYAGWGSTQLLAELARRSWGLVFCKMLCMNTTVCVSVYVF